MAAVPTRSTEAYSSEANKVFLDQNSFRIEESNIHVELKEISMERKMETIVKIQVAANICKYECCNKCKDPYQGESKEKDECKEKCGYVR